MDNTDNRTDLPEGRAEQTREAADTATVQAAAGKRAKTGGMTRRTLCLGIGGAAVMLGLGGLKVANPQAIIRPPGGQDEDRLISACIRCEKCYEICPRDVIRPAHIEDGILKRAHTDVRFQRQLLRLVHRGERRHAAMRLGLPHARAGAAERAPRRRTPSSAAPSSTPTGAWHTS